jgi:hypothetical protein
MIAGRGNPPVVALLEAARDSSSAFCVTSVIKY